MYWNISYMQAFLDQLEGQQAETAKLELAENIFPIFETLFTADGYDRISSLIQRDVSHNGCTSRCTSEPALCYRHYLSLKIVSLDQSKPNSYSLRMGDVLSRKFLLIHMVN
jgi:hypothetical protein